METPYWVLTLAYWLHMVATVIWIGSLGAIALLVVPASRQVLSKQDFVDFLGSIQKRFDPLAWFCLLLLVATGLIQMVAHPNYAGFLSVQDRWAAAILVKHIMFLILILLSAYMTWFLLPGLRRIALKQSRDQEQSTVNGESDALKRRETLILRINFILGLVILALTAIARTS